VGPTGQVTLIDVGAIEAVYRSPAPTGQSRHRYEISQRSGRAYGAARRGASPGGESADSGALQNGGHSGAGITTEPMTTRGAQSTRTRRK